MIERYPYGRVSIYGQEYITFKFRRSENILRRNGEHWGKIAGGMYIACKLGIKSLAGERNRDHKGVNFVKSTNGYWYEVDRPNGDTSRSNYGFVDMGYDHETSKTAVSIQGSW